MVPMVSASVFSGRLRPDSSYCAETICFNHNTVVAHCTVMSICFIGFVVAICIVWLLILITVLALLILIAVCVNIKHVRLRLLSSTCKLHN